MHYRDFLMALAVADAELVKKRDETYGGSWCRRGGRGAYFATIRKVDRIEEAVKPFAEDVFAAMRAGLHGDEGAGDGLLADVRDLRRYLLLWEAYMVAEGAVTIDAINAGIEQTPKLEIRTGTPEQPGPVVGAVPMPSRAFAGTMADPYRPGGKYNPWAATMEEKCSKPSCDLPEGHNGGHANARAEGWDPGAKLSWEDVPVTDLGGSEMDQCIYASGHKGNHLFESDMHPVEDKPERYNRCSAARVKP